MSPDGMTHPLQLVPGLHRVHLGQSASAVSYLTFISRNQVWRLYSSGIGSAGAKLAERFDTPQVLQAKGARSHDGETVRTSPGATPLL